MEDKKENQGFSFTYSAKEQEELRNIRQKYISEETDKMELIRTMDRKVSDKASAVAIILGVMGTLIMGVGMCCTMVWKEMWFVPGIIIGIIGIGIIALAYPVYNRVLRKEREKIAPEIIRLTDELIK